MNHQPYYSLKRSKAKYFSTSDQLNGQSRRAGHSFLSISALCEPLERSNKPLISYDCERRIGSRDSRVTNKDDVVCSDDCSNVVEASRRNSIASSYVATRSDQAIENGRISRRKMKRKTQMLRKEFRAARSLFTVVGFFALCWLPLHIINCFTLFCPACRTPAFIKDFAILLSHANSLVNPIIYAFHLNDMKIAFQCIIKCSCSNFNSALNRQSLRKNYRWRQLTKKRGRPFCLQRSALLAGSRRRPFCSFVDSNLRCFFAHPIRVNLVTRVLENEWWILQSHLIPGPDTSIWIKLIAKIPCLLNNIG